MSIAYTFVCVRKWIWRPPRWVNFLAQTGQTNGFSPVCVRMWFLSPDIWVNAF